MITILKFFSPTCGPCKALDNNLKAAEINYTSINAADPNSSDLLDKYEIHSIPTLVKVDGDKVIDKFTGIMTVDKLKEWVNDK